ncbi:hypothetical protein Bca4012_095081 [Brassica carinata]
MEVQPLPLSLRSFNVKWQLIRTKLDELYTGLAALSNLSSDFNPSLTSLISAVLASLLLRGRFDLVSERRDVGGVEFECGGGVANWNRLEVIAHRGCGGTIHISRETRGN